MEDTLRKVESLVGTHCHLAAHRYPASISDAAYAGMDAALMQHFKFIDRVMTA